MKKTIDFFKNKINDFLAKKNHDKKYYSFGQRLFFNTLLFLILLLLGIFFLIKSFDVDKEKVIKYFEYSDLDYKVYLKENEFYEQEYLDKDLIYVASLIDKIKVDFNYNFNIDATTNIKFDYKIMGKLQIMDAEGKYTYYEKEYVLLNDKQVELTNGTTQNINETIEVDYNQYNRIANDFKNTYGVGTTSKMTLYFMIDKTVLDDNWDMVDETNNIVLSIPLSEKAINIDMNYKDIDNNSYVVDHTEFIVDNIIYALLTTIFVVFSMIFAIKSIRLLEKLRGKKNVYDIYINKILSEYDRLIVETTTPPTLLNENKENIIVIDKFSELLDVRDNLKQPIMYYIVTKHEKCYFYIINNDKIYLNTVKRVNLEKIENKEI